MSNGETLYSLRGKCGKPRPPHGSVTKMSKAFQRRRPLSWRTVITLHGWNYFPCLVQGTCMVRTATHWFTLGILSSNPFWSGNSTEREHLLLSPGGAVEGAPTCSICSQDRSWMCITGFYGNHGHLQSHKFAFAAWLLLANVTESCWLRASCKSNAKEITAKNTADPLWLCSSLVFEKRR